MPSRAATSLQYDAETLTFSMVRFLICFLNLFRFISSPFCVDFGSIPDPFSGSFLVHFVQDISGRLLSSLNLQVAERDIIAGEVVEHSYGAGLTDAQLALSYGFTLLGGGASEYRCAVDLPLPMLRAAFATTTGGALCDVRRAALERCGAGSLCGGTGGEGVALMLESNWSEGDGDEQEIDAFETGRGGLFVEAAVVLAMDLTQLEATDFLNAARGSAEQDALERLHGLCGVYPRLCALLEAVVLARDRLYWPETGQRSVTLAQDEDELVSSHVRGSVRTALAVRVGERRLLDAMGNFFGGLGSAGGVDQDSEDGEESGEDCGEDGGEDCGENHGGENHGVTAAERPAKRQR